MKQLTDSAQLSRLVLKGFKSIASCDLELGSLNILIGPNGAGKSNFVEFFRMIQQILEGNLQLYVSRQGGPDALLHFGRKKTGKEKNFACPLIFFVPCGFRGIPHYLKPEPLDC